MAERQGQIFTKVEFTHNHVGNWIPKNDSDEEKQGDLFVRFLNQEISAGRPDDTDFVEKDFKTGRINAIATMTDAVHEKMLSRCRIEKIFKRFNFNLIGSVGFK